jgi:O-antigen ligase
MLSLYDFNADNFELIGSGRLLIWYDLIVQWMSSPTNILIGTGPGAINLEPGFTERVISAHSMYVETLFTFGVVGLILLLLYLISVARAIRHALPYLPPAEGNLLLAMYALVAIGMTFDSYFLAAQLVWVGALVHGVLGLAARTKTNLHSNERSPNNPRLEYLPIHKMITQP